MRYFLSCLAIVVSLTQSVVLAANMPAVDPAKVDTWLQPMADAGFLSGCVLVARGDEVLYERCFGQANAELGVANAPTTRFAIASVTKAMQQVLLARMVEAGTLTSDDKLSHWLADFPRGDEISVMQLATHEAAIPHRVTEPGDEIYPRTATEMVELVKEKGLLGEPGGEESYSSAGYSVLARVLEVAGDASWSDLMQREVFAEAGMEHTVHPERRRLIPQRASSYEWTPRGYRLTEPKDLSFLVGAGSLFSSPQDLLRFVQTAVNGGYGETTQEYLLSADGFSSNGLTNGYRTFADFDAATDLTVIVCANVVTGALDLLRTGLPQIFASGEIPVTELPDIAGMTTTVGDFTSFEGRYELRPGRELGIRSAGGYLDVDGWMLLPLGPDVFFCVQDFGEVTFERDDEGKATGLLWGESAYHMRRVGDVD